MGELNRYIPFRLSEKQFNNLKERAEKQGYKDGEFSAFIRDSLLESNGIKSDTVKKELYQLRWEINKVGTNINQATKRINSSNGRYSDVVDLLSNQEKIMSLIEEFENKIEDIWR